MRRCLAHHYTPLIHRGHSNKFKISLKWLMNNGSWEGHSLSFPLTEAGISEHVCISPGSVQDVGTPLGISSRRGLNTGTWVPPRRDGAVEVRELPLGFWLWDHPSAATIRR